MSEWRRVVVTGLGAVTPVGNNVSETWNSLKNGKNGIAPITFFDTEGFKAKLAAEVKGFEPKEYLEVNEILRTDRYAQLAVAAAAQAVEDSGIEGKVEPEKFGVMFGTGIGGIGTFEVEHTKLLEKGPRRVSSLFIPMMIGNMAAGMIAIKHDCRGSAMPAVTACASGSNAIGEAVRMIRHGYAEAVIAGGAEASITKSAVAGFVNMQALSTSENPDEASLPFDKRRGGFVIGEGAVSLVLEEYEHAKARGARIYGEVCGYGSTCDAYHITAPHPQARGGAQAMKDAMREAGYSDEDKVYMGNGDPKIIYGLNNSFRYKNFDLNIYFYGEAGRKRGASYYEGWTRMDNGINVSTYALKAFSSNNLTATDPTYVRGGNGWGDYYVKSIYYVRCGSITLGYKVPISQKIVNNLRVYVDVNNPFVITNWTGLDPETDNGTYAYPNVTSYNFGVSISF